MLLLFSFLTLTSVVYLNLFLTHLTSIKSIVCVSPHSSNIKFLFHTLQIARPLLHKTYTTRTLHCPKVFESFAHSHFHLLLRTSISTNTTEKKSSPMNSSLNQIFALIYDHPQIHSRAFPSKLSNYVDFVAIHL